MKHRFLRQKRCKPPATEPNPDKVGGGNFKHSSIQKIYTQTGIQNSFFSSPPITPASRSPTRSAWDSEGEFRSQISRVRGSEGDNFQAEIFILSNAERGGADRGAPTHLRGSEGEQTTRSERAHEHPYHWGFPYKLRKLTR